MAAEVAEQPAVLAKILDAQDEFAAAAERIAAYKPRFVLIAARGTSDHAALYAKYLAEVVLQLPAGLVSPSALTVYGARPEMHDVLFIAVSQSGRSPDLVDSLSAARSRGALTVAATKSYTAELLSLYLLIAGVRAAEAAARLPEAAARTLALTPDDRLAAVAAPLQYAERLVVTARGYAYATAREAALKLMETSYLSAMAFSGADLLHGPLAMIDRSVPVIAVASPGRGGEAMAPVLERLAELGAHVLQLGSAEGMPIAHAGIPEELLPVLEILPLQRLAWRLALDRGVDPDRPRGLSKVTQTL
jgi:glutamine---fructose-6-phosphate transaminase (isomerizing)